MEQQRGTAVKIGNITPRPFDEWRHVASSTTHTILKLVHNGDTVLDWSHEVCWGRVQDVIRKLVPMYQHVFELYCQYWTKLADADLEKRYIDYVLSLAPGAASLVDAPPADGFGTDEATTRGYLDRYTTVRYEITSRKTFHQAYAMHTLLRYLMEFPAAVSGWAKLSEWLGDPGKAMLITTNGCEKPRLWSGHGFSPSLCTLKSLKHFDMKRDIFDSFSDVEWVTLWSHVWRPSSWSTKDAWLVNPPSFVFTKELCDLFMEEETHTIEWMARRNRLIGEANAKKYEPVSIGNI